MPLINLPVPVPVSNEDPGGGDGGADEAGGRGGNTCSLVVERVCLILNMNYRANRRFKKHCPSIPACQSIKFFESVQCSALRHQFGAVISPVWCGPYCISVLP